ncbi:MAG TPA: pilus assembly protein PilP [Nitrospiraceae bacterium]|nr:pilus assembly protein PilP [Nitrospiraceae bacterium]
MDDMTVREIGWWRKHGHRLIVAAGLIGGIIGLAPLTLQAQVNAIRPADSLKVPSMPEMSREAPNVEMPVVAPANPVAKADPTAVSSMTGLLYDPSGRRDPFAPIMENGLQAQSDAVLPPLQRVGLTELSLIGIVWGAYGYTAMVQTPDGKGYSIRRGTRVGPNNGVVSSITDRGIIVQERFTDVYGNKQEREYVKLLHAKEDIE